MFKPNQRVIVLKLHKMTEDGSGVISSKISDGCDAGKYVVDTHYGYMIVEPERIVDAKEYWRKNGRNIINPIKDRSK